MLSFVMAFAMGAKCNSFLAIDEQQFERLAGDVGFQGTAVVARNSAGTKLFLTRRLTGHMSSAKIISTNSVVPERFATGRAILDDNGSLISWVTNNGLPKGLAFATGQTIPLLVTNHMASRFEFTPGAEYFMLDEPLAAAGTVPAWMAAPQPVPFLTAGATNMGGYVPTWDGVFRSAEPTKPLFRLPNDFYASGIFTRSNEVIVSGFRSAFGRSSQSGRQPMKGHPAWVLVYSGNGFGYGLIRQLDISRYDSVLDVDPTTGILLVRTKGEISAEWGLFDPETGKYKSLGRARAFGFFLDPTFAEYVKSKMIGND